MKQNKNSRRSSTINPNEISNFSKDSYRWWDEDGPFAPLHRLTPARMGFLKDVIGTIKDRKILDIGCGGGLISMPLARLGAKVSAVDADEQAISVARNFASKEGLDIRFLCGAAEDLAAKSEKFDVVLALEIIEHVDNPQLFVELCVSLVKPGGMIILSTLNRTWKSYALGIIAAERLLKWVPAGTHDWKKFVKPSELAHMLQCEGMNLTHAKGMVYNPLTSEFSIHPHDLDVNYFIVATKPRKR